MVNPFFAEFKANHDYLSVNRTSRVRNETQEFFQIGEWLGYHERSIEQVKYFSQSPNRLIKEVEYEGWRRHVADRRRDEGGRIILHVRSLEVQAKLARSIEGSEFKKIGWIEPIRVTEEDPILCVNFCENSVEDNVDYIDNLFRDISLIATFPIELITDLKYVIAYNCVDRFKRALLETGFTTALSLIRPCSLDSILSPFYVAALFCRDSNLLSEARELVSKISRKHRQFEEGRQLERATYEQEIKSLKKQNQKLLTQLQKKKLVANLQDSNKKQALKDIRNLDILNHKTEDTLKQFWTEKAYESVSVLASEIFNLTPPSDKTMIFSKPPISKPAPDNIPTEHQLNNPFRP